MTQPPPPIPPGSAGGRRTRGPNQKFCSACGELMHVNLVQCPHCGAQPRAGVNKVALVLLTLFLGGIGGHKFYLKKYGQGAAYLLFFWTGIPSLIALVELIVYLCTPTEKLQEKYEASALGPVIALAGLFGVVAVAGILAAIAIPQYLKYVQRAQQHSIEADLTRLHALQEAYRTEHPRFAATLEELEFAPSTSGATFEIVQADEECFHAVGHHERLPEPLWVDCAGLAEP